MFIFRLAVALSLLFIHVTNLHAQTTTNVSADTVAIRNLIDQGKSIERNNPAMARQQYNRAKYLAEKNHYVNTSRVYNAIGYFLNGQGSYDSALIYYRLAYSQNANDTKEKVSALKGMAQVHLRLSTFDSSRFFLDRALSLSLQNKSFNGQAEIYAEMGNVSIQQSNYVRAISEYQTALTLYDSVLHDLVGTSNIMFNLANVHASLKNTTRAMMYVKKGQALARENQYYKGLAYGHKLLGRIYRNIEQYDSALYELKEALMVYKQANDQQNSVEIFLSIGNTYYDLNAFRDAMDYYSHGLALAKTINLRTEVAYLYSAKSYAFFEMNDAANALAYCDSAQTAAKKVNNAYLVMDGYELKSMIWEKKGEFAKALRYHKQFTAMRDSINSAENKRAVDELENKYENNLKASEIALLRKDQRITKLQTYGLIVVVVMLLVVGFLLFSRMRVKIKAAHELADKQRELDKQQKALLEAELESQRLSEEKLKNEIAFRNKELTTYTLNLIQKNELLEELRATLENVTEPTSTSYKAVMQKLNYGAYLDKEWSNFKRYFEQVHSGFFERLLKDYPDLTASELKLCALLKLNLESKEMATILGISPESVKVARSRLRKKLNLDADQNLALFMASLA